MVCKDIDLYLFSQEEQTDIEALSRASSAYYRPYSQCSSTYERSLEQLHSNVSTLVLCCKQPTHVLQYICARVRYLTKRQVSYLPFGGSICAKIGKIAGKIGSIYMYTHILPYVENHRVLVPERLLPPTHYGQAHYFTCTRKQFMYMELSI